MSKYKNLIYGVLLIALSIFVIMYSTGFPKYVVRGNELPGPSFFPTILSIFLIAIGLYEILKDIVDNIRKKERKVKDDSHITKRGIINILVVVAGIILFVPFIDIVGFKLGAFIFAAFLMYLLGIKFVRSLIYSAVLTAVIIVIFELLFRIPFPQGYILPF
jgi:hypothetical protein